MIKIVYPGTSNQFMQVASVQKENVLEGGGFDHYPYYSGGSRWGTYYNCFDTKREQIEVCRTEDNVTLLYGTKYRVNEQLPQIKK